VLAALRYLAEISLLARRSITLQLDNFLAGTVDINAVVRQYCRNTETKDQARMYQFMRDLIACRDWYDRDSGCILSRDELCDIINFLAVNRCMSPFIACFLLFLSVSCIFLFITLYYVYDLIINNQCCKVFKYLQCLNTI